MSHTVYLVATPEVEEPLVKSVLDLLNDSKGPISFRRPRPFGKKQLAEWMKGFSHPEGHGYSAKELIGLATHARHFLNANKKDFVVIFTSYRHARRWFSACEGKDIFITTRDWEFFTKAAPQSAIAHQVAENIFQSMVGIGFENAMTNSNVHMVPRGCVNDFCGEKQFVLTKMQNATICADCLKSADKAKVDADVLDQIITLLEDLRNHFRPKLTRKPSRDKQTILKEDGKIYIGNSELKLPPRLRVLFILFFGLRDGMWLNRIDESRTRLEIIQEMVRRTTEETINRFISDSANLNTNLSLLNSELKMELGEKRAKPYLIRKQSRFEPHRMELHWELRSFPHGFDLNQ